MMTTDKTPAAKQSYQSPALQQLRFETDGCILQASVSSITAPTYEETTIDDFWTL